MHRVRAALMVAGLVVLPSTAWAQTTSTTTQPTTTTTTATTTTSTVTRIEDLVCSEPVNSVATCVDPQGRIVLRVDDPRQVPTTVPQPAERDGDIVVSDTGPAQPAVGRELALTG